MRKFKINPEARAAAEARSTGVCERCKERRAVHMHHLTYKRAGHELPEDLEHRCVWCHIAAHPEKRDHILNFEMDRLSRMAPIFERQRQEEEEEYFEKAEKEHWEKAHRRAREEKYEAPAWNLGKYESSGYDPEEVAREDGFPV